MAVRSLGLRIEDLGFRISCLWERFGQHWGSGLGISIRGFQRALVLAGRVAKGHHDILDV